MNNKKAVAASAAMVMFAALGTGGLLAMQQSGAAESVNVATPAVSDAEIVVEYIDAAPVDAAESTASEPSVATDRSGEEVDAMGGDEHDEAEDYDEAEEHEEEIEAEDYDEAEDYEDGDEEDEYEDDEDDEEGEDD